ncbi:MAG TPA: tyrosine-type recombinase/integrase [Chloroflexota bacterium]|nr:tyrosine-type recombinase/integrase [Chloroflexota bacterium]
MESSAPSTPTWTRASEAFLASLAGRSPRTRATYASGLRRFVEYLQTRHLDPDTLLADEVPLSFVEEYHAWLIDQFGRERRPTVVTYLAALRALCRFLDRRGWAAPDATYERVRERLAEVVGRGQYRTPRIDRRLPLIVTTADELALPPSGDAARRLTLLRDRALLHVLYSSGMRRAEVSRLDRDDLEDGWRGEALITGKGDKERVVFLSDEALAAVRRYLAERNDGYAPLFLRHDRGRGRPGPRGERYRLSPQSIWGIVGAYARLAGVRATPHAFRHTKASVMLNRGAKLSEVQDILGHASPETTKRIYAHYEVAHLREAFDRFSASPSELVANLGRARSSTAEPSAPQIDPASDLRPTRRAAKRRPGRSAG